MQQMYIYTTYIYIVKALSEQKGSLSYGNLMVILWVSYGKGRERPGN